MDAPHTSSRSGKRPGRAETPLHAPLCVLHPGDAGSVLSAQALSFFFSYEEMDVMLIKYVLVKQGPGFIMCVCLMIRFF